MSIDYNEAVRLMRKGRKAEQRGKAFEGCITNLLTSCLLILLKGWMLMLAVGVIHAHWWPVVPTIGYGWAVAVVALLPFGGTGSSRKDGPA